MPGRELHRLGSAARHGTGRRRVRTLLWFLVWGFVGFAVAYGPLDQGLGPASILSGTALGALMALCINRAMVSRRAGRKWLFRFVWPARLLFAYLVIIVLLQLHATGALPPVRRNFGYQFERLAAAITAHYPALDWLETEWASLRDMYKPRAEQATNEEEFMSVVADMLAGFGDRQVYAVAEGSSTAALAEGGTEAAPGDVGSRSPVYAEVLPSGIGYIEIVSFAAGKDVVRRFDDALDELGDVPALIIDVRQTGGEGLAQANRVAGRLLAEPFTYATVTFRHRLPHFAWVRELTQAVSPRGDVYMGPIVVLTDEQTMRAAEAFVFALKASGRAAVIGMPTAGIVGLPIVFRLPGGEAHFTVGRFKPVTGPEVEGIGVLPDVAVSADAQKGVLDQDVALMVAIDYLIQRF